MKRKRTLTLLAAGLLAFAGCEPPQVTTALPPGAQPPAPEIPDDQKAEALGEQAALGAVQPPTTTIPTIPLAEPTNPGETKTTEGGVKYETVKAGDGPQAKAGQKVNVKYVGTFENGTEFDSGNYPFRIGVDSVIAGWHEGIAGMKVGETRKLVIPPDKAYGAAGRGEIPPNTTLHFQVELQGIE